MRNKVFLVLSKGYSMLINSTSMSKRCTTMLLFCLILLAACDGSTGVTPPSDSTKTVTATRQAPTVTTAPTPTPTPTSSVAPQHFSTHGIVQGQGRPDELVFHRSESVLCVSDFYNGTISSV